MTPTPMLQPSQSHDHRQRLVPPAALILRRASGYLELGELLLEGEAAAPPTACRLFARSLAELNQLDAATRGEAAASLLEGEALRALGEWEAAIGPLTRAAEATPGHVEAWLGLGWCHKRLGDLDAAIDSLRRGLAVFPDQPILHYNLACYHSLAGSVPAAIEQLTRAIAIDDRFRDLTGDERDFDAIRSDPRFVAATSVTV